MNPVCEHDPRTNNGLFVACRSFRIRNDGGGYVRRARSGDQGSLDHDITGNLKFRKSHTVSPKDS